MTRTSGYYAVLSNMNNGKREEVSQRKKIKVPEVIINEVSAQNIHLQK